MKGGIVQISWHGSDPILSVDFHSPTGLLATAGADRDIKLWSLHRLEKSKAVPTATFKSNLSYHGAAVNVVRFSPSGELLASGADGGELLIWRINSIHEEIPSWKVWRTLRFHLKDVLDLEWSPDGVFLVSGSVDNTCIIWNITKGTVEQVLADHQHYVQGVTWDPAGKYVASLSGDRTCRIYSLRSPTKRSKPKDQNVKRAYTCQHILCKKDAAFGVEQVDVDEASQKQVSSSKQYMFYDENMPSFFRRLVWSPDGSFLLIPSGVEKQTPDATPCSVSYIVSRNDLSRPALQLPAASKPVVAARFCPIIFSLCPKKSWKHDKTAPDIEAFRLPYRLVFAVATLNSVFIYDTEQSCPIAIFGGLHYAPITDIAWSSDAKFLAVSSQDGYCTLVGFDEGDLGTPLPFTDLPPEIASLVCYKGLSKVKDTSYLSSMETSEQVPGAPLTNSPDFLMKGPTPGKDPATGTTSVSMFSSEKSSGKQSESQVRPQKIRRINPMPISELLQKLPASTQNTCVGKICVPTVKAGGLDIENFLSAGVQCGQNVADVLVKVPQVPVVQSGLVRCTVIEDKRLEVGQESSDELSNVSEKGTISVCKDLGGKETLAKLRSQFTEGAQTLMVREAGSHMMMEPSEQDQQVLSDSAEGLTATFCQEHTMGLAFNPPNSREPQDQYTHMSVRPLKSRRISPNLVSDDLDEPRTMKPIIIETSLASSNDPPGLQLI